MDPFQQFKETQKQQWPAFALLEIMTRAPAALLVKHSRVRAGQRVLDVACGTGVVAVTAARRGCKVTGLDLTPELLERARENAGVLDLPIDFHEGDVEALPFPDAEFDAVLSQFGHMFAPRPDIAIAEMLRVLKPGGAIAFSTWPPEHLVGLRFQLALSYAPPPPIAVPPVVLWGDPTVVRERLGAAVKDIVFDRGRMLVPSLSPRHFRLETEKSGPSVMKLIASLAESDPAKLEQFRSEFEVIATSYFEDNAVRQDFLMTRATKL